MLEIRDANEIFLVEVIFPRAFMYSIWAMSLMVFSTIACSFFGKMVLAVVSANYLGELVFNWGVDCVCLWVSVTDKLAEAIQARI